MEVNGRTLTLLLISIFLLAGLVLCDHSDSSERDDHDDHDSRERSGENSENEQRRPDCWEGGFCGNCPQPDQPADHTYCCGTRQKYCCTKKEYLRQHKKHIMYAAVAGGITIVTLVVAVVAVVVYCNKHVQRKVIPGAVLAQNPRTKVHIPEPLPEKCVPQDDATLESAPTDNMTSPDSGIRYVHVQPPAYNDVMEQPPPYRNEAETY